MTLLARETNLNIRITKGLKRAMDTAAEQDDISTSAFVRRLIATELRGRGLIHRPEGDKESHD